MIAEDVIAETGASHAVDMVASLRCATLLSLPSHKHVRKQGGKFMVLLDSSLCFCLSISSCLHMRAELELTPLNYAALSAGSHFCQVS